MNQVKNNKFYHPGEGLDLDVINCAVCGSISTRPMWTVRDTLLDSSDEYKIVRCAVCGTLRMQPRPPFDERRRSFTDDYPLYDWALGRKKYVLAQRFARYGDEIEGINRRMTPGRLLDVGCGDGFFMLGMKERGWEVKGIELHEKVAAFARDELGLDVVAGAEHDVDWDGRYDCITVFGVIEDVDDPNALLKRCYEHLEDDGMMVVQTHNIASPEARYFGPDWFNVEAPRHVWHFSPATLKRLLENNRFRQEDLEYYGSPYVTERSIEAKRGGRPFPSSLKDRFVRSGLVVPAARLLARVGQGIMIDAYCRKAGRSSAAGGPKLEGVQA